MTHEGEDDIEIVENGLFQLWGLVKEYSLFFHRGHAFFDEWTSEVNDLLL